jgi:hypothetical protein
MGEPAGFAWLTFAGVASAFGLGNVTKGVSKQLRALTNPSLISQVFGGFSAGNRKFRSIGRNDLQLFRMAFARGICRGDSGEAEYQRGGQYSDSGKSLAHF